MTTRRSRSCSSHSPGRADARVEGRARDRALYFDAMRRKIVCGSAWYLRLPATSRASWAGVVRVECSADLSTGDVLALAGVSQLVLPRHASLEFRDPRAPRPSPRSTDARGELEEVAQPGVGACLTAVPRHEYGLHGRRGARKHAQADICALQRHQPGNEGAHPDEPDALLRPAGADDGHPFPQGALADRQELLVVADQVVLPEDPQVGSC